MKTIPLVNSSEVVLIDDADYPELSKYPWFVQKATADRFAVVRADATNNGSPVYMSRTIVHPAPGRPVLHVDGDYLNHQRNNLHIPKPQQNPAKPKSLKPAGPRRTRKPLNVRIEAIEAGPMREWLYYCKRNWSEMTVVHYARVIRVFVTFILERDGRPVNPAGLTISDVEQFIDYILQDNGRNTANSYLTGLKSFFTWQTKRYGADNIGAKIPMLKPEPPEQRVLTDEEYHAILKVADPLEKDAIQFLAHTGLRRGEFLNLKWSHVRDDMTLIRFLGKGRKERAVPLNATARNILKKYKGPGDMIPFVARYRNMSAISRMCARLARRAGIPRFGPHALRHYFCTRLVRANANIKKVSKALGHSSLAVTEHVYCHLLPEDLIGLTDVLTD